MRRCKDKKKSDIAVLLAESVGSIKGTFEFT